MVNEETDLDIDWGVFEENERWEGLSESDKAIELGSPLWVGLDLSDVENEPKEYFFNE